MNEEIYEGTPSQEDVLIGTDSSGYNRYRRPDGSTYVHYPYSRMATVTAYSAKDENGQPIRTADNKLITGKTQAEADRNRFRYDMSHWAEANRRKTAHLPEGWRERLITPDMNTFNAITGGVFNLTPIQVGRGVYNISQGKDPGFILGNSGVVSEEYAQEHPWLALGANVLGEGLTGGLLYGGRRLLSTGQKAVKNYKAARAFDNIVKSEIKKKDWFNKTFPQYTYKPQPYNYKLGLPEPDPNTFYHYMYYPSPTNINGEGVVRFSNFTIKPKYNGSNERIWWDKGNVPTGDVVLASKSKHIDEHVLSHPEKYSPYRGYYENSYYTSGEVPLDEISIYTKNPFTGYYDGPHNTITYNPPKQIKGKTSLKLLEKPSKLTEAELAGTPKGERNLKVKSVAKAVTKYDDLLNTAPVIKKTSDAANKTTKIKITAKNAAKITDSQWDEAYNAAIANNDLNEAQRLRDLHFKVKAPNTKVIDSNGNPIKTYHGNMIGDSDYHSKGLNPYSTNRSSRGSSGYFSSSSEEIADSYRLTPDAKIHQVYLNYERPLVIDAQGAHYSTIGTDRIANKAFSQGSDGVIIRNVEDAGIGRINGPVVGEARIADDYISTVGRAKSSDAVTKRVNIFTGKDEIIPLSERDNFLNPDVRYSWLLPVGLTTTFGLTTNNK